MPLCGHPFEIGCPHFFVAEKSGVYLIKCRNRATIKRNKATQLARFEKKPGESRRKMERNENGLKKYIILFLVTAGLVCGFLATPLAVERAAVVVEVGYPRSVRFYDKLYVSGTVEEKVKSDVTVELPVVPAEVKVLVGDWVEPNQLLATVDIPATRQAILSLLEAADGLSGETLTVIQGFLGGDMLTALAGEFSAGASWPELSSLLENEVDVQLLDRFLPTEIRAPAAGQVTAMNCSVGALSLPGTPVCTLSRTESLQVKMSVPEESAGLIAEGDTVSFQAAATGGEEYSGKISRIFPAAVKTLSGTSQQTVVGFYVALPEDCSGLKPGYTVDGVIRIGEEQKALVVPYEAIRQDEANQEFVYLAQNGRAVRRDITVSRELSGGAAVSEGLSVGDRVIQDAAVVSGEGCLVRMAEN